MSGCCRFLFLSRRVIRPQFRHGRVGGGGGSSGVTSVDAASGGRRPGIRSVYSLAPNGNRPPPQTCPARRAAPPDNTIPHFLGCLRFGARTSRMRALHGQRRAIRRRRLSRRRRALSTSTRRAVAPELLAAANLYGFLVIHREGVLV